ncbi:hypothetical protein FVEG_16221 [Fusarium verticillioides 7600]|uniref:Uncharacterized protein n=1 Tax=Gibberella moniliformis (strain M3125 / FGSC 7600) TaxID=334819 RepID=W7M8R5_GIBM7|nr:hypothetical protein FVEG_16221 [Fusarium verticillioides 7600]EWG47958.1 hypothetical protein FVEG_16221 [Fusarium verticillioides 7600]
MSTTGQSRADFRFRHSGTDTRMLVTCSFGSHCLAFVASRLVLPLYLAAPMKQPSYVDNEWIILVACACICACTPRLSQPALQRPSEPTSPVSGLGASILVPAETHLASKSTYTLQGTCIVCTSSINGFVEAKKENPL